MSEPDPSERRLLEGCKAGEAASWRLLVSRYAPLMRRAIRAKLRGSEGDAEDVVQRILARLAAPGGGALASFQGRSRLGTWLVALSLREAGVWARGEGRARARVWKTGFAEPEAPAPLEDLVRREEGERLGRALSKLSARDRLLLRAIYWEGLSYREAAALLGVSETSVSPLLGRAREALKTQLGCTGSGGGGPSSGEVA